MVIRKNSPEVVMMPGNDHETLLDELDDLRIELTARDGCRASTSLRNLCGIPDPEQFPEQHRQWVQEAISSGKNQRES